MKRIINYLNLVVIAFICGSLTPGYTEAGMVVIVNPKNDSTFTKRDIYNIFLKKTKFFPNGTNAIPVYQKSGSKARKEFDCKILRKNQRQLKSYWVHHIFTGKGLIPQEVDKEVIVKNMVAKNPDYIGYIDTGFADQTVKVVFTLK